jgi:hypothetical protein
VAGFIWARDRGDLDFTRCNGKIERCNGKIVRCNGKKTRSSKREYSDVSINDSSNVIWKITREYLNYDECYCVLGVMSDGKCIRGVPVPSCFVMWVTWQLDTRRSGDITYDDLGDLAKECVETTSVT